MPSFYPSTYSRNLPLTPPDYAPYPNSAGMYCSSSQSLYGLNNDSRYNLEGYDKFGLAKQQTQLSKGPGRDMYQEQAPAYPTRREHAYGNIGPPILPPIRIPENVDATHAQQQMDLSQLPQEQPKEEKVAGGVAAHLDYEMDQMVDFVAEMAQGMYALFESRFCLADIDMSRSVQPTSSVSSAFRKYVSQILTSTRLPSSTIVLSLHYLSTRMTMLSSHGVYTSSNGHLYHMLTTALMLASKFLDDNTFQNRSWAEVSHIAVADLNKHELDWLKDIHWDLHIDSTDPQGFSAWLKQWKSWQAKKVEMSMEALKLTPVDASLRSQQSFRKYMAPPTPVYTPTYDSFYGMGVKDNTSPSHWQQWPQVRTLSPPLINNSGATTPEWYGKHVTAGYGQGLLPWPVTQMPRQISTNNSPYYSAYGQHFGSGWGHGAGCGCGYCPMHQERFPLANSRGLQSVAG